MSRTALTVALLLLAVVVLAACDDGDGGTAPEGTVPLDSDNGTAAAPVTPVTPVARPEGVPEGALPIEQTTRLGRIERSAGEEPRPVMARRLVAASCSNGVITLETSGEAIYAPLPCENFWDEQTAELFLEKDAAILLEVSGERFRIFIETLEGAQSELTVTGIWVE